MKYIKLFESFDSGLKIGDMVFIKPAESAATFVAVDPTQAKIIERSIIKYDPSYEGKPIKLMVTDSIKNYVIWDVVKETARLVDESEAYELNETGDYQGLFLKGGELEWREPTVTNPIVWPEGLKSMKMSNMDREKENERSMNPKYIIPVVKNRIVYVDGHGSAIFIDEPIGKYYSKNI
jgi:hypothetical protein